MKKEQILLVVAAGVAGLVVWQSTGLYASVNPGSVPGGKDVDVTQTVPADPRMGLAETPPAGRNFLRQLRAETRKERPDLDAPPAIGFPWVRPLPWPELPPSFWGLLREPMTAVAKPAADESAAKPADEADAPAEDPAEVAAREAAEEKARDEESARRRIADAAKLVTKEGKQIACRLTPLGDLQGQEVWRLLERWPNVRFLVEELNDDGKSVRGKYEVSPETAERYQTVHLEHTLENEYHEERIRRAVKPGDRQANIDLAQWVRQVLAPKWGVPATRLALRHFAAAKEVLFDGALVAAMGDTCQDAYDLDEEIRVYTDYLQGPRANETPVIIRLGDAYERGGALPAAREQFEKAAKIGDVEGRVRAATIALRLARSSADLDAAYADFEKAQAAGQPNQRARAFAGMARARLAQGNVAAAVQAAKQAREADPSSFEANVALGVAQYAAGQFADADQSFGFASAAERSGSTRARSNRAMALLAQDKLTEAVSAAEGCLSSDALNYLDPLLVLGEAQQRWGDLTRSNDTFQTALQRAPRNAWVLLRLASARLRDGLPKPAMDFVRGVEGAPGLLQLAPESVDALHVAGLAAAALDPPDWEGAAKYLRRALDKEPKNLDLLYDLAKILHLSGASEDAVQLLEKTTDANTGTAKNDARVLALLAYVYFDGGKPVEQVYATFDRARRAVQAPWTKDYIDQAYEKVVAWDRTRQWLEDFERTGNTVGNGWREDEALGVQISLDGHRCVFKGRAVPATDRAKMTGLSRDEDLAAFQTSEVTVQADTGFEFVVHLYQGDLPSTETTTASGGGRGPRRGTSSELGIGRARDGRMMLYVYGGGDNKMFNIAVKDAAGAERRWPDDGALHRVGFRRTGDPKKGEFEIWLDDERIATPAPIEIAGLSAAFGKAAKLAVHVDADQQAQVDLQVESVLIEKILTTRR